MSWWDVFENPWLQASAAMLMRSALFWDVTTRRCVIPQKTADVTCSGMLLLPLIIEMSCIRSEGRYVVSLSHLDSYTVFVTATVDVSPYCHSLLESLMVVEQIVVGPYLKSWGLGMCYKFRKPTVFCWRLERKWPQFIWKCSPNSNDFR
jgi:hypothetical protein